MNENEYRSDVEGDIELLSDDGFEKLKSKNLKKKIGRRIGYVLVAFVILSVFVIGALYFLLKVKTIEVTGSSRVSEDDIIEASGIKEGTNLFAVNKKEAAKQIKQEYAYISEAEISRSLPSTVKIAVSEETASYICEICGDYFTLSKSLRILDRVNSPNDEAADGLIPMKLPEVKYAVVGEKIRFENDLTYEYVEEFIAGLTDSNLENKLTEIDVSNKYHIYLIYEGRFRIYIGDNSDVDTKLIFASLMINNFEADRRGEVDAHDITVGSVILDER